MKIAFDYQVFAEQEYGGISRYFCNLARAMSQCRDTKAKIIAPLHINGHLSSLPPNLVCGKRVVNIPGTAAVRRIVNQALAGTMAGRFHPDIIHETYYSMAGSALSRCPGVVTVYDMIHDLFPGEFPANDGTVAAKRKAVERADHVICISENTRVDLMRLYGTPASKISVVHLGFGQFSPEADVQRFASPSGRPFILYVGQRGGYKNFTGFLKSLALSKRILSDFDVIAFGGADFSTAELSAISALGFAEGQVIHKRGGDDLLSSLYRAARLLVYPSLYEGFGIPPLEAMSLGCPVASSSSSSLPEVVGDAAELFDPADEAEMCTAVENVVFSAERTRFLIDCGYERVRQFSWGKCAQETLHVYNMVI